MVRYGVAYLGTAFVFFALDYLWLSRVAIGFYKSQMGSIMREQPNFTAAGLFYLFYIAGIVYFAVAPAMNNGSVWTALLSGALLGLFAYGTYDMTNLATLKVWTLSLSLVDMAWGTVLTGLSAAAGYLVVSRFLA
ncbi:putative membrane protein [Agrobacterium vitis]|nr:putative membrane protein [Agrobacterium vitis]MBE1439299.1 putative membrane protein [Agrobacterium vitis]